MKLTPSEYESLRSLFFKVAALNEDERATVLDRECRDDAEMRANVEQLLARSDDPSQTLREIAAGLDSGSSGADLLGGAVSNSHPQQIGDYRIIRKIGEGGMGTVYEAEQHQPRRTVALKVIRRDASSRKLIRRFEHESQILGRLQHPCIAQIYDAGTSDFGSGPQPYFAMELVRGLPLNAFAKTNRLSTRERLVLFIKIGEAVHHAHQKGIIHRDLKPENILVNAQAQPKVLDFGVARVTNPEAKSATVQTEVGQIIGTLSYMSPEQAGGPSDELDIRSDVHNLGVVLFQLLTDRLPYNVEGVMVHEAVRAIREDQPALLSSVDHSLRGDLDVILAKALEKDRDRRYQSALDLSADVRRFLESQPIIARSPSAVYQLRKFAQRHKGVFGASAAAFLLLILGVIGTSVGFWRATQREREAVLAQQASEAALDEAEAVTEHLASMLASATPENLGREVLVTDVLNEASASIAERFADKPLIQARLRQVIGTSYFALGRYADAEPHEQESVAIRRRELGPRHPLTLMSINNLANTLGALGNFAAGGDMHRTNYEIRRSVLGEEHPDTLQSMFFLATALYEQDRIAEAKKLQRTTLDIQRRVLGKEHRDTLQSLNQLANMHFAQRQYEVAEKIYRETLEIQRRVLGKEHPFTLTYMNNIGAALWGQGRYAAAERQYRATHEIRSRVLGDEHPDSLRSLSDLTVMLREQGQYAEAEDIQRKTLGIRRRVLGKDHPFTQDSTYLLASILYAQGRYADAEELYRRLLDIRRRVLGDEHPHTLLSSDGLAATLDCQGRYVEAQELMRKVFEIQSRNLGAEHPDTLLSTHNLGVGLRKQGRYAEAVDLLRKTLESRRRVLGEENHYTLSTMTSLAENKGLQGDFAGAEMLYRKTLETARPALGNEHPFLAFPLVGLAEVLLKKGEPRDARELLDEALRIRRAALLEDHPEVAHTQSVMGEYLTVMGQFADAEALLVSSYERLEAVEGESGVETSKTRERLLVLYEAWGKPEKAAEYQSPP